jgi:hypothetical protein
MGESSLVEADGMDRRSFLSGSLKYAIVGAGFSPIRRTVMIDSHVHVWKHTPEFPFAEGAKPPDFDIAAEDLLRLMGSHGVARTVLIQVSHYRWDNRYLVACRREFVTAIER